jgi:hypothetical protein
MGFDFFTMDSFLLAGIVRVGPDSFHAQFFTFARADDNFASTTSRQWGFGAGGSF